MGEKESKVLHLFNHKYLVARGRNHPVIRKELASCVRFVLRSACSYLDSCLLRWGSARSENMTTYCASLQKKPHPPAVLPTPEPTQYGWEVCFCVCPRPHLCLSHTHVKFMRLSLSGSLTFSSWLNHYLHVTWVPVCSCSYRLHKLIEKMLHEIMQKIARIYVIFLTSQGYTELIINFSSSIYRTRHLTSSLCISFLFWGDIKKYVVIKQGNLLLCEIKWIK